MHAASSWRTRALTLARTAAAAAGIGVGWLLLSGSPAAAGDLTDALAPATTGVVSSAPVTKTAATTLTSDEPLLTGTTSALASGVSAVPAVAAPLLDGPLAPLAPVATPVLEGTTGAVSGIVTTVGETAGGVVDGAEEALPVLPAPAPESIPVPLPSAPAPDAAPVADAATAPDASAAGSAVPEATGAGTLAAAVRGLASLQTSFAAEILGSMASSELPTGPPSFPDLPLAVPGTAGSVFSGSGAGSAGVAALAGGAFLLAVVWRQGNRLLPGSATLPASLAFDPGSTPD